MILYTISYAISFIATPEIYSAGLAAPASRRRFVQVRNDMIHGAMVKVKSLIHQPILSCFAAR
jgi:hypothetical protein